MTVTDHLQTRRSVVPAPEAPASGTVVSELVEMLAHLGVQEAFGVSGGAMAAFWDALSSSPLRVRHFRHEGGATFAAIEAGFASGRPTVVFTTTGPGLTNAMTGILAAREERARVIVVSAYTSASSRGRFAIQETTRETLPPALCSVAAMGSSRTWRWTPPRSGRRRPRRRSRRGGSRCRRRSRRWPRWPPAPTR